MEINFLKFVKEQVEKYALSQKILNISISDRENLNKIINFALSWWLKNIGDINDGVVNFNYDSVNDRQFSKDKILKLNNFIYTLGFNILKQLLVYDKKVVLKCNNISQGLLKEVTEKCDCQFLEITFPIKSVMTITNNKIWIDSNHGNKIAFDIYKNYDFDNLSLMSSDEYILPSHFLLSSYDFTALNDYKKYIK